MSDYDPLAVAFYDIAHSGALVRGVANAVADKAERVEARSVVLLAADELSAEIAQLALALREPLRCPVVLARKMPSYIGALDVVVALSEKAEDEQFSESLSVAATRGASIVLLCPEGPMLDDAPEALIIDPLPGVEGPFPLRALAGCLAVIDLATGTSPEMCASALEQIADEVDREMLSLSPERDLAVNPARTLAEASGRIIHVGANPASMALARVVATLWTMAGKHASALEAMEMAMSRAKLVGSAVAEQGIFYDPFLDEGTGAPLETQLWDIHLQSPEIPGGPLLENVTPQAVPFVLLARAFAATAFFGR